MRGERGHERVVVQPALVPPHAPWISWLAPTLAALGGLASIALLGTPMATGRGLFYGVVGLVILALRAVHCRMHRIVLAPEGLAWRSMHGRHVIRWERVEEVTVDPYTETAHVRVRGRSEPLGLELGELTLDDERIVRRWLAERVSVGEAREEQPTAAAPLALPWSTVGLGPGGTLALALSTCLGFGIGLLQVLLGHVLWGSVLLLVVVLLLTRCSVRALRVDAEGAHLRRWPLPGEENLGWTEIESLRGGTDLRPLLIGLRDGTWRSTRVVLTRSQFQALEATCLRRTAAGVFA